MLSRVFSWDREFPIMMTCSWLSIPINGRFFFFSSLRIETPCNLGFLPSHLRREQSCSFFLMVHFHSSRNHSRLQPCYNSWVTAAASRLRETIATSTCPRICGVAGADCVALGGNEKTEHPSYSVEHWVQHQAASQEIIILFLPSKQSPYDLSGKKEDISALEM